MIGLSNPISETNPNTTQDNFYTNLIKNEASELEKQLADKNPIIDFLSAQIISKPPDLQKNKRSDNGQVNNKSDYGSLPLKKSSDDRTKNAIIIGDPGLSKSKKVEVLDFPGAASTDINCSRVCVFVFVCVCVCVCVCVYTLPP